MIPVSPWLRAYDPIENPIARLICFPHAGGGAAVFRDWQRFFSNIEVIAVELPGRGARTAESPIDDMDSVLSKLGPVIGALGDRPFAFFGHSLGASLAYRLTDWLSRKGGALPFHLFLSARRPPHVPSRVPHIHELSSKEFKEKLAQFGATPQEVLADKAFFDFLTPMLRADFKLAESQDGQRRPPLPVDVTVFAGTEDTETTPCEMDRWKDLTSQSFRSITHEGGHFHLTRRPGEFAAHIGRVVHSSSLGASRSIHSVSRGLEPVALRPGEVHIWFCRTDRGEDEAGVGAVLQIMSDEERNRSEQFRFSQDRRRYIVSRGLLRRALSKYADVAPSGWRFVQTEHGRPEIDPALAPAALRFNLTHTHGLVACAIAVDAAVGIDAERIRFIEGDLDIAKRYFAKREYESILAQPVSRRAEHFYRIWTLKEAYLKAIGRGLSLPLDAFTIEMRGSADIRVSHSETARRSAKEQFTFHQELWDAKHVISVCVGDRAANEPRFLFRELD